MVPLSSDSSQNTVNLSTTSSSSGAVTDPSPASSPAEGDTTKVVTETPPTDSAVSDSPDNTPSSEGSGQYPKQGSPDKSGDRSLITRIEATRSAGGTKSYKVTASQENNAGKQTISKKVTINENQNTVRKLFPDSYAEAEKAKAEAILTASRSTASKPKVKTKRKRQTGSGASTPSPDQQQPRRRRKGGKNDSQ